MTNAAETLQDLQKSGTEFQYMVLGRMHADCKYFLGNGGRHPKHLYMLNVEDHIEVMKGLHEGLKEKPEWLTMDELLQLEVQMKEEA